MMAFLSLTKPRISVLFAITALAALIMEKSFLSQPLHLAMIVFATFLVGGGANALNQYFERDIDKKMARTAKKRPLPLGLITPQAALIFAVSSGLIGIGLLWYFGTLLSAILGFVTILYYSFYYTLWLKPRTPYNIVIGGAAGATGPLIGWAAATGSISLEAFILFLIIFFWTPPHFWALALCIKEDYKEANYPMLPLVAGDERTRFEILVYTLLLIPLTLTLYFIGKSGLIYFISALLLGLSFIALAINLYRKRDIKSSWKMFGYSIAYLLFLFVAVMVDSLAA